MAIGKTILYYFLIKWNSISRYETNMLFGAVGKPNPKGNFTLGPETQEEFSFGVKSSVVGTVVFEKDESCHLHLLIPW